MSYKHWILATKKEWNEIDLNYFDLEGNHFSEPFCFPVLDEALFYSRICTNPIKV